jgi:hypothetical protein
LLSVAATCAAAEASTFRSVALAVVDSARIK